MPVLLFPMELASQLGICSGRLLRRAPFLCLSLAASRRDLPACTLRRAKIPIRPSSSCDPAIALDVVLLTHHRRKRGRLFSITHTRSAFCNSAYLYYFVATAHVFAKNTRA